MVLTGKLVQIFCGACRNPIADHSISFDLPIRRNPPSLHDNAMKWEKTVLSSLVRGGNPGRGSFSLIEDLAFLVFYFALPWSTRYMKSDLAWWDKYPLRLSRAVRLDKQIYNAALTYPMSSTVMQLRWPITAGALAIVQETPGVTLFGPRVHAIDATLRELFWNLGDSGREEMVFRANRWPRRWREQVQRFISEPRCLSYDLTCSDRVGWAFSYARYWANYRTMPKYSKL